MKSRIILSAILLVIGSNLDAATDDDYARQLELDPILDPVLEKWHAPDPYSQPRSRPKLRKTIEEVCEADPYNKRCDLPKERK